MEKKTFISIRPEEKQIFLIDTTDSYNEPRGYNKKVQGFKKVAEFAKQNMARLETLSMYEVIRELDTVKDLRFHTYCAMD